MASCLKQHFGLELVTCVGHSFSFFFWGGTRSINQCNVLYMIYLAILSSSSLLSSSLNHNPPIQLSFYINQHKKWIQLVHVYSNKTKHSGQIITISHDLTPKCSLVSKGNPLISGKSRLVKYYSIWPET